MPKSELCTVNARWYDLARFGDHERLSRRVFGRYSFLSQNINSKAVTELKRVVQINGRPDRREVHY